MFSLFSANTTSSDASNATASSLARQTSISRGHSFKQRLKRFWKHLMHPFALLGQRPPSPSGYPASAYPMSSLPRSGPLNGLNNDAILAHSRHGHLATPMAGATERIRADIYRHPDLTYASIAEHPNSQSDPISLPFRLSVGQIHGKTHRNLPYLRQSWTRIDFVAILSFWIAFGLAMAGFERGVHHIGIFRAMSVIRTARLLTITSGTTVRYPYSSWFFIPIFRSDHHALSKNCQATHRQSSLFRVVCYGSLFVRQDWFCLFLFLID